MRTIIISFFIISTILVPLQISHAQEASTNPRGTLEDRLNQAIQEQNIALDDAARSNIVSKCQASQLKLANIQQSTDSLIRKRIDVYSGLQKDLIAIQLRMVRQGSDASEIDLLTGKIQQELDDFTLTADSYGTYLNDSILVNCVEKPEMFQAGLMMIRMQRAELLKKSTVLKDTLLSAKLTTYEPLKKRMQF